jgi:hypothetical protein
MGIGHKVVNSVSGGGHERVDSDGVMERTTDYLMDAMNWMNG